LDAILQGRIDNPNLRLTYSYYSMYIGMPRIDPAQVMDVFKVGVLTME